MLWLVAIPLIHIHPEADHAHGTKEHHHGGVLHSVLSQDLECEFHAHFTHKAAERGIENFALYCNHSDTHQLNHDEIGFSLLSSSFNASSHAHELPLDLLAATVSRPFMLPVEHQLLSSEYSPLFRTHVSPAYIRPPPHYSA